ncbi:hypothetical protein BE15_29000 [Sorangium cellulosum]|uniref:Uncharacterized protein n=1 Tax=Sorangium cellulosum TaxID=56 RepID=A0A150QC54_SORCE|nr:hypothetical protein BE15_29000 [Sorangium cellulosum]
MPRRSAAPDDTTTLPFCAGGAHVAQASASAARPARLEGRRARAGTAVGRGGLSGGRIIGAVPMRERRAAWVRSARARGGAGGAPYSSSISSG